MNGNEILAFYFYGIDIVNKQGTSMDVTTIETYIRMAQDELEHTLGIKINKQVIEEVSDYYRDEFQGTGFVKTKYNINEALKLEGVIGTYKQLEYPREWLTNNLVGGQGVARQITVVPNSNTNTVSINAGLFAGSILPYIGLINNRQIGSYWHVKYITGFGCNDIPYDILNVIGKLASINLFHVLGDLILGAGIASSSLSLDSISTSVSSTSSATSSGYGSRIIGYLKDIENSMKNLRSVYKGLTLTSI